MTDVTVVLGANGLPCRVFIDGVELSNVMSLSTERGVIDRVELTIAPTQLLVIPPAPTKKAPKRKRTAKRRRSTSR